MEMHPVQFAAIKNCTGSFSFEVSCSLIRETRYLKTMIHQETPTRAFDGPPVSSALYEQVASRISELVSRGTLRPGEKVPSVRSCSRQQNVSISTVTQAYRLLEDRGVIEARPQSGYYVRPQRCVL